MNEIEKVLVHALFTHLHHNIDQVVDFKAIEELNLFSLNLWDIKSEIIDILEVK